MYLINNLNTTTIATITCKQAIRAQDSHGHITTKHLSTHQHPKNAIVCISE